MESKMLNLLIKAKPWMVASFLVATSVFGQNVAACPKPCPPKPCPKPCPQPCPPTQMCEQDPCCPAWPTPVLNAAYNYPARTQTRCPWDFFACGSFIYWQPVQENMELCFITDNTSFMDGRFVNVDFDYKPGFQVGLGMNFDYDNWESTLEYTWFHGTHSQSASVDPTQQTILALTGNPQVTAQDWDQARESWRLNMDFLDLDLGRTYYVGMKLMFRSAFGARGQWIRQRLTASYTKTDPANPLGTAEVCQRTNSWAVGPRATLKTSWMIGEGFRLFGNGGADIVYTRYTKLRESSQSDSDGVVVYKMYAQQNKLGYPRPHLDLELGIGWGTYLDCNNWYMDFSAGYGFQAFFNQNMFRKYTEANYGGRDRASSFVPNGDLFVLSLIHI